MSKRKIRRLRREADKWYANGVWWEGGQKVAAPSWAPHRIAFDAGREAERRRRAAAAQGKKYGRLWSMHEMPLKVWTQVLAEYLRTL